MRHAWLIIAHNEFEVLQRLVSMLDAPESDFYIHFDRKVQTLPEISVERGRLTVLEDRIDVCWGTVSQIKTELLLLETALKNGPYGHYHIISGTHLPLKPVEELIAFYDSHPNEEIMRFWPQDEGDADFKLRRYHFPMRYLKSSGHQVRKVVVMFIWKALLKIQKVFGIRHHTCCHFQKTDNWLSLSQAGCSYLVRHKNDILKKYRWSFCGDEYFVATELSITSCFTILDYGKLLYVDFIGDTPKVFPLKDYCHLQEKDFLWARKFTLRNTK